MVVVVGAGVNTRMDAVELPVPTATSFASLGRVADDDRLIADYLAHLRDLVAQLAVGGGAAVHDDVEGACLTVGQAVVVSLPDGTAREGVARRIDGEGRLVVDGAGLVVNDLGQHHDQTFVPRLRLGQRGGGLGHGPPAGQYRPALGDPIAVIKNGETSLNLF